MTLDHYCELFSKLKRAPGRSCGHRRHRGHLLHPAARRADLPSRLGRVRGVVPVRPADGQGRPERHGPAAEQPHRQRDSLLEE